MDFLRRWLLSLCAAGLAAALLEALAPEGAAKRTLRLCAGALLLLTMLGPLAGLNAEDFSMFLSRYTASDAALPTKLEQENERLSRMIIQDRAEAYILDKAAQLNMNCQVSVQLKTPEEGGTPYPYAVTITAREAGGRQALSAYIEENLAIPAERQTWQTGE